MDGEQIFLSQHPDLKKTYEGLKHSKTVPNQEQSKAIQLASYAEVYNDLLRRLLPIAGNIPEEKLGEILRRSVVPAFKNAEVAKKDKLTGLPKREAITEITNRYMDLVKGIGGVVTFAYIDTDNFKMGVNDIYGHEQGNIVLQTVGAILQKVKRSYDIAGIIKEKQTGKTAEGDEFGMVFYGTEGLSPEELCKRIEDGILTNIGIRGMSDIGLSIGIAQFDSKSDKKMQASDLISHADIAMYHAKTNKTQKVKFINYAEGMVMPPALNHR